MTTAPRSGDVSRIRSLVLVFVGGALGTGIREAFALAFPSSDGAFPATIFLINVVGAFILGALLETLSRGGPDAGRRRLLRLLFGTGLLGGFTTYSAFAVDTALLLREDAVAVAVVSVGATLVIGFLASALGMALAGAARDRFEARRDGR